VAILVVFFFGASFSPYPCQHFSHGLRGVIPTIHHFTILPRYSSSRPAFLFSRGQLFASGVSIFPRRYLAPGLYHLDDYRSAATFRGTYSVCGDDDLDACEPPNWSAAAWVVAEVALLFRLTQRGQNQWIPELIPITLRSPPP
jgi:hypothetical protein